MSNVLYNKRNMKKNLIAYFLTFCALISLSACGSENPKTIIFHTGPIETDIKEKNDYFKFLDIHPKNKRLIGWSTDNTKENIISDKIRIPKEEVINYFGDSDTLHLYGIFADVINVSFVLDTVTTYSLDSDLNNIEIVPEHNKQDYIFQGWSKNEDKSTIDLEDVQTVTFSTLLPYTTKRNLNLTFYPVYVESNI